MFPSIAGPQLIRVMALTLNVYLTFSLSVSAIK